MKIRIPAPAIRLKDQVQEGTWIPFVDHTTTTTTTTNDNNNTNHNDNNHHNNDKTHREV